MNTGGGGGGSLGSGNYPGGSGGIGGGGRGGDYFQDPIYQNGSNNTGGVAEEVIPKSIVKAEKVDQELSLCVI